jgi:hypothetical protein
MKKCSPLHLLLLISACLVLGAGCSATRTYMAGSVVRDVVEASQRQGDVSVIKQGSPAYLMLLDGLIYKNPDNQELLIAGARGYLTYAALAGNPSENRILYSRAKEYAMRALDQNSPFARCREKPLDQFTACVEKAFSRSDVPLLYWGALSWGSWISSHLDSVEALAQLPRVEVLMKRVLEIDDSYSYGGAYLFLGIYEAVRPGGDLAKAKKYFLKGIEAGQGKLLTAYVSYATYYAMKVRDRKAFHSSLTTVMKTSPDVVPDLTLVNTVARKKAQELLEEEPIYFSK